VLRGRLLDAGLDESRIAKVIGRLDLATIRLGESGQETRDAGGGFLLSYGLVMVLYLTVILYGMQLMRGVLEEKQSRVVEVIISVVRPSELMLGKILGIGAVGLTQFLIWDATMLALTAPGIMAAVGLGGVDLPPFPLSLVIFFAVFFLLGYLLYGTLYAGIAAVCATDQEAQQLQMFVTIFLIVPLVLIMKVFSEPDGAVSIALSLFPLFAPLLMFLRMTITQVPAIQVAAAVVLLGASILGLGWIIGKIYRVGILSTGARPSPRELLRWVREA
jgi:ABC-2 type transport system permease protein